MIKFRTEPSYLQLVVIFEQKGKKLAAYIHPILKPEDEREALMKSYQQFRIDHPKVDLLEDRVAVRFDKVD